MNKFPKIALVGLMTHEMFEYLKHNNVNPKAYTALDSWSPNDEEFSLAFEYIKNDSSIDPELATIIKQSSNIDEVGSKIQNNREFVRQIIKSFHNFYYSYTLDNVKDGVLVMPYPLIADREIEFDYYIVLNQDYEKIYNDLNDEGFNIFEDVNYVESFRRVNELINKLPKDKTVVTIDIPWTPHDSNQDVSSPPEVIKKLCDTCTEFYQSYLANQSNG